jgi:ferric-dicitrate binding protein FerR (iron transport regulator)
MDNREFSNLIERYKRGEISSQEQELLERFLESFQTNSGDWIEQEMGNQGIIEKKIYSRILRDRNKEKIHSINRTIFFPSLLQRAAAIALFFILSSGIIYLSGVFSKKTVPVVWHDEVTSAGEKSIITLSDSSQVTLNADSKLRYPDRFDNARREVYLEGEGYFVVKHITHQPFILHTGNLSTTVLGTKFNVSAYPENKAIAVSLLEGKVQVTRSEQGTNESIVVLKPQEQLMYDKELDVGSSSLFDSLEVVGWKDNIYKFENAPLDKVLSQLERAFGIKFTITDQKVLAQKITIKFEKNSPQTVMDVIKRLTGLEYKIIMSNGKIREVVYFRKPL